MKLNFNTTLDFKEHGNLSLWKAAEKYLNFGQKTYTVVAIRNDHIDLKKSVVKSHLFLLALKVSICFTIALPITLAAILIRTIYRKKYEFELIDSKKTPEVKQVPEPQIDIVKEQEIPNARQVIQNAYKVEDVIARIYQAKEEGLKVGIFLGRVNNQDLPAEQGWKWFSLDNEMKDEGQKDHHLQMDFNNEGQMSKIHHLFNKAVVDRSTIKCFDYPWPTLHQLLEDKPESELITEGSANISSTHVNIQITEPTLNPVKLSITIPLKDINEYEFAKKRNFDEWVGKMKLADVELLRQEFYNQNRSKKPENWTEEQKENALEEDFVNYILEKENIKPPGPPTYTQELYQKIKDHLERKFFNEVTLHHGPFPYRAENQDTDFWVIRSPKNIPKMARIHRMG